MTLDEHVVRIRYEADLESFNKAIAIAEQSTGDAVARMTRVLGSLHQPFDALFAQLAALQEAANSFTLPDQQIQALQTLTNQIAANTANLNTSLKEIRDTFALLARDIESALTPLSDPQLEKNLEALARLLNGISGEDVGSSIDEQVTTGLLTGFATFLALLSAPVSLPVLVTLTALGAALGALSVTAGDAIEGLVSGEQEGIDSADELLNRFSEIVRQTAEWATEQERVAKALAESVVSLCTIVEKLETIEQNGGCLPICCESGGGKGRPQVGRAPFRPPPGIKTDGDFAEGGLVFPGGTFLVGERGPELFVPSTAGTIIPNSALSGFGGSGSGGGGGDLGAGIARLTAELQRLVAVLQQASAGQAQFAAFSAMSGQSLAGLQGVLAQTQGGLAATGAQAAQVGTAIEEALGGLPEEFGFIAEAIEGSLNAALSGNIRSWGELREAALGAAREVLGGILQSEEVRAEIGELADVIDGVLNQALSGSIDSWEDLGRVALDVLQQIATEILKTQLAGQGGGGGFLGAVGDQSEFLVAA